MDHFGEKHEKKNCLWFFDVYFTKIEEEINPTEVLED